MPALSPSVYVLDRRTRRVVYEAKSLSQAKGYADARRRPSMILFSAERSNVETLYQLAMIDTTSGQVVSHGPVVEIFDALDLLENLRIVMLPVTDATECEVPA